MKDYRKTDMERSTISEVPSPLLYDFYIKIMENIPRNVQILEFADSIAVYCSTSSIDESKKQKLLENLIKIVKSNLRCIGLDLAPQKIMFFYLNNRYTLPGTIENKVIIGNRSKLFNFNDLKICYQDKYPEQLFLVHIAAALRHCFQDIHEKLQLNAGYNYISF